MPRRIFNQDGKELITQEEIREHYMSQLPERQYEDGQVLNVELSVDGDGEYSEQDIRRLSDLNGLKSDPSLVKKGADYLDDLLDKAIPGAKDYPYTSDASLQGAQILDPLDLIYINGAPAKMCLPNEMNLSQREKGKGPEGYQKEPLKTQFIKAAVAGLISSGTADVTMVYPVRDKDGKLAVEHVRLKPDFTGFDDQELRNRQNLQVPQDKIQRTEMGYSGMPGYFRDYMEGLISEAFHGSSAYKQALEKSKEIEDIGDVSLGIGGAADGVLPVPLTGDADRPQGMSQQEYAEFRQNMFDLKEQQGRFADEENEKAQSLRGEAVRAFDRTVLPRLNEHQDSKQPYYDVANLSDPMDRIRLNGTPAREYLEKSLGYDRNDITDEVIKAEVMTALTSGTPAVDLVSVQAVKVRTALTKAEEERLKEGLEIDTKITESWQFKAVTAQIKPDLSGLDQFAIGEEKTRSQIQQEQFVPVMNKETGVPELDLETGRERIEPANKSRQERITNKFFKIGRADYNLAADNQVNAYIHAHQNDFPPLTGEPTPPDSIMQKKLPTDKAHAARERMDEISDKFSASKYILYNGKEYKNRKAKTKLLQQKLKEIDNRGLPPKGEQRDSYIKEIKGLADDVKKLAIVYHNHATKNGKKTSFTREAGRLRNEASVEFIDFADDLMKTLDYLQKNAPDVSAQDYSKYGQKLANATAVDFNKKVQTFSADNKIQAENIIQEEGRKSGVNELDLGGLIQKVDLKEKGSSAPENDASRKHNGTVHRTEEKNKANEPDQYMNLPG